ncbi:MAG: fructose-bisphosphatase class III [Lachnospiraceae bacterium]|nr:fructose-bisphosphatase class III [Lachnospiraceae bacterium]
MARYTYVISDIHGQFDALMQMIEQIAFSEEDELYIIGDVIDRGPKSVECIRWIMEQDNVLTLLGNHELILYDTYLHNALPVYKSLTQIRELMTEAEQKAVMRWIEDMPECKFITVNGKKFYLNHTQIASPDYFKEELTDRMFPDYARYYGYNNLSVKDLVCIHGHIPTMEMRRWNKQERNSSIWKNKSNTIIDIDCGAGYPNEGGQLGCLRLNDMKEFYVAL